MSYNVFLQLSIRVISFVINGFAIRHLQGDVLGIYNVRLMLLYGTTLYLAHEAFRKALTGCERTDRVSFLQCQNAAWLALPLGLIVSVPLVYIWLYVLPRPADSIPYDTVSLSRHLYNM